MEGEEGDHGGGLGHAVADPEGDAASDPGVAQRLWTKCAADDGDAEAERAAGVSDGEEARPEGGDHEDAGDVTDAEPLPERVSGQPIREDGLTAAQQERQGEDAESRDVEQGETASWRSR